MALHRFEEYELRLAGIDDLTLALNWTTADPDHAGRVNPRFWIEQSEHAESWVLHDLHGPIFFFKAVKHRNHLEIHVQFAPPPAGDQLKQMHHRSRIARALIRGMKWLEENVAGFDEMRFDTENPFLSHFCVKHLGFTKWGNCLSKQLAVKV